MESVSIDEIYRGISQFNAGEFFDCHDTIEAVWIETRGRDRLFFQGLIQVAVAYYHAGNGNLTAAVSQLTKAIEKLRQFPGIYWRIDLNALVSTIRLHRAVYRSVIQRTYNPHAARGLKAPQIIVH